MTLILLYDMSERSLIHDITTWKKKKKKDATKQTIKREASHLRRHDRPPTLKYGVEWSILYRGIERAERGSIARDRENILVLVCDQPEFIS